MKQVTFKFLDSSLWPFATYNSFNELYAARKHLFVKFITKDLCNLYFQMVEVDIPQSLFEEQGRQLYGASLLEIQVMIASCVFFRPIKQLNFKKFTFIYNLMNKNLLSGKNETK